MPIIAVAFSSVILLVASRINFILRDRLNPYSIMAYVWSILIIISTIFARHVKYYPMKLSGLITTYGFLFVSGITTLILVKSLRRRGSDLIIKLDDKILRRVSIALFFFCLVGNLVYWYDVNKILSIGAVLKQPWLLKNAILMGSIKDNSFRYFGRNLSITGTVLALLVFKTKRKTHILMLMIYLALAFLNIRRDPIIIKVIYVCVPLILVYAGDLGKIIKRMLPLALLFMAFFFYTLNLLTHGVANVPRLMYAYTVGSFNSLQALIDYGLPQQTRLPLNYTWYWGYSFLKYVNPSWSTPDIILPTLRPDTTNVYTALSGVVIDAGGDYFTLALIVILYGVYVGALISVGCIALKRRTNFFSITFYSALVSCAVRSYMNPTFSNLDLIFGLAYGLLLQAIFGTRILKKDRSPNQFVATRKNYI